MSQPPVNWQAESWQEPLATRATACAALEQQGRLLARRLVVAAAGEPNQPPPVMEIEIQPRHLLAGLAGAYPRAVVAAARSLGLEGRRLLPVLGEWLVEDRSAPSPGGVALSSGVRDLLGSAETPEALALMLLTASASGADATVALIQQIALI